MNEKDLFYEEKKNCGVPLTHVLPEADRTGDGGSGLEAAAEAAPGTAGGTGVAAADPALAAIDELYGAADVLSIQNAMKHRKILLALSVSGMLLTLAFLLYDEAELYGLILACGVVVLFLFFVRRHADRLDCHRKYLEYRVLAESLRVQYFLSYAGVAKPVAELLPWPVKKGLPWIYEILLDIHSPEAGERHSILDCWVRDQKKYHESALRKNIRQDQRNGRIARVTLVITIGAYLAALLFELFVYRNAGSTAHADLVRAILKILLGTMSAITLFTGSYYGKMSLSDDIEDHRRMIELYEQAETDMQQTGETEELLLELAREFLNENSSWFAYQSKNTADIAV